MRGQNDVVELPQRVIGGQRLGLEHVQPGARQLAFSQRRDQGRPIDDRAAGRVDQKRGGLHQAQLALPEQMVRRAIQRAMHAHEVRASEQLVQVDQWCSVHLGVSPAQVGIVRDHVQPEGARLSGDKPANIAQPDQPEALASQPPRRNTRAPKPATCTQRIDVLEQTSVQHEQQAHGVVADFVQAIRGGVAHQDAALGRRVQVDHVDADAEPRDDPAASELHDDLTGQRHPGHDQGVGIGGVFEDAVGVARIEPDRFQGQPTGGQRGSLHRVVRAGRIGNHNLEASHGSSLRITRPRLPGRSPGCARRSRG